MSLIRCTRPACRAVFEVATDRLGKNLGCIRCGELISAAPLDLGEGVEEDGVGFTREVSLPLEALLEDVRSLWNVGSIFRTADGAGVGHLYLCGITGQPPRAEIRKTALGAEEAVPWSHVADAYACAQKLAARGDLLVALEATRTSVLCTETRIAEVLPDAQRRVCLIVGNEVAGVSPALRDLADVHVQVPMRGLKRSLNVAVAFGVGAYTVAAVLAGKLSLEGNCA